MRAKKGVIDPVSMIIGFVALVGAVSFFVNQPNYGLVLLIISTLIEAITRIVK